MKSKILILAALITLSFNSFSQNWSNANLRADGQYVLDGVEALYEKTTCGNDEFILIKFINKNNTKVTVEWIDAIFEDGNWTYEKNNTLKSLVIQPNQEIEGKCGEQSDLKIKINSIINSPEKFEHYMVSGLKVIK